MDSLVGQVHSLQRLLLKLWGLKGYEFDDYQIEEEGQAPDDGEEVDLPEALPQSRVSGISPTERSTRQISRITKQLETAMSSSKFVEERSPDLLATDLKIASVLLGVGLRQGWISYERFFDVTHTIWSSIFFDRVNGHTGWLEHRVAVSEDREHFIETMRSETLAATLIGWYLSALSPEHRSIKDVRFRLQAALAVSRLPWVWRGGNQADISRELGLMLYHTGKRELDYSEQVRQAETHWWQLIQRGEALCRLETEASKVSVQSFSEKIQTTALNQGEILWQGKAGYCVVLARCLRTGEAKVPVLKIQGKKEVVHFQASLTLPMRALIDERVIPMTNDFGDAPRVVLREYLREMSSSVISDGDHVNLE